MCVCVVGCARFFFFCGVLVWLFLWGFWFCWFLPSSHPGPYFLPGFLCSLFGPTWLQSWFGVRCFWPSSLGLRVLVFLGGAWPGAVFFFFVLSFFLVVWSVSVVRVACAWLAVLVFFVFFWCVGFFGVWGFWFCWFLPSSHGALLSARVFVFPVWPHLAPELVWGSVFLALLSWPSSPCLSRRCLAGCGFLFLCPFFFLGGVVGFSCSRCVCVVGRVWSGFSVLFLFLGSGFFVGFVGFLFFVFFVFLFLLVSCPLTLPGIVSPFPSPPGSSSGARGFVFSL